MTTEMILGPQHGVLSLHTGREGLGSMVGHDLTIHVEDWTGVVSYNRVHAIDHFRLVARLNSLQVVRGDGGLKSLSDKDKVTIRREALKTLDASAHPDVVFDTETVTEEGHGVRLAGSVTIAGTTRPLSAQVTVTTTDSTRITAETGVIQSRFGIKPYTAMLGALRLRDLVDIRADLTIPNP